MERDLVYWLLAILLVAIGLAGVVLPGNTRRATDLCRAVRSSVVRRFCLRGQVDAHDPWFTCPPHLWRGFLGDYVWRKAIRRVQARDCRRSCRHHRGTLSWFARRFVWPVYRRRHRRAIGSAKPRRRGPCRIRRDHRLGAGCCAQTCACFINDWHIRGGSVFLITRRSTRFRHVILRLGARSPERKQASIWQCIPHLPAQAYCIAPIRRG